MADHYYSENPQSESRAALCRAVFQGHALVFQTDAGVFSRGGLDRGTALLLEALPPLSGSVLDLGCGWGPVGISLSKAYPGLRVTMTDINSRAVALSRENARRNGVAPRVLQGDGFAPLGGERFSAIITNPPIRAGKQVIYPLFEKSPRHLLPGGALYLVIQKKQGAPSALAFLRGVFPQVRVLEKKGGFWVLEALG